MPAPSQWKKELFFAKRAFITPTYVRGAGNEKRGELQGLAPKKRGRRAKEVNPLAKRVAWLGWENRRLSEKLRQAETIIEVQKKSQRSWAFPRA
jgi:hypothetical protein